MKFSYLHPIPSRGFPNHVFKNKRIHVRIFADSTLNKSTVEQRNTFSPHPIQASTTIETVREDRGKLRIDI